MKTLSEVGTLNNLETIFQSYPEKSDLDNNESEEIDDFMRIEIDSHNKSPIDKSKYKQKRDKYIAPQKYENEDLLTNTDNRNETVKTMTRKPIPDVDATQFEQLNSKFDIGELQKQDPFCRAVYDCVSEGIVPSGKQAKLIQVVSEDCFINQGIVYKLKLNTGLKLLKPTGYQLLVPRVMQEDVLKQAHSDTAHAALNTFIGFLRDNFTGPNYYLLLLGILTNVKFALSLAKVISYIKRATYIVGRRLIILKWT